MTTHAIQLTDVTKDYGHFSLQDINLALPAGHYGAGVSQWCR